MSRSAEVVPAVQWKLIALVLPPLLVNLVDGFWKPALTASPVVSWTVDFVTWVVLPIGSLIAIQRFCGMTPATFGLRGRDQTFGIIEILAALVLGALVACAFFLCHQVSQALFEGWPPFYDSALILPKGPLRLPAVVYLALTAGDHDV